MAGPVVHFLQNDLSRWDAVASDALALTFFSDERPLRGAAGLADWRLCGRLSRLLRHSRLTGKRGEQLMMPPGRRLPFNTVLLFGLGKSDGFTEEKFRQHVSWISDVLKRAQIDRVAIQLPGRATGLIAARRALEVWIDEVVKSETIEDSMIIDTRGGHKEMADVLHDFESRGRRARA